MNVEQIYRLHRDEAFAKQFEAKAEAVKREVQNRLWDERREFFLQMYRRDEERDGFHGATTRVIVG